MIRKSLRIALGFLLAFFLQKAASATIELHNEARLQRGAKLFMNYCSGCHSLGFMRYQRLAKDLGLTKADGQIDKELVSNLMFSPAKLVDPIRIAMPSTDARQWFGLVPPDLSLIARQKGADWIYHYLKGFYPDAQRPFGANNTLMPDTAMPNVLYPLAIQERLSPEIFDKDIADLVSFLVYVAEPAQLIRERLGWKVLLFLALFCIISYLLKQSYWKKLPDD